MKRDYSVWLLLAILGVAILASSCEKKCNCIYTNPNTGEQTVTSVDKDEPCAPAFTMAPELYHKECL